VNRMSSPEIPPDKAHLILAFKSREPLTEDQLKDLFSYLRGIPDMKNFLMEHCDYTPRDYNRLKKRMQLMGVTRSARDPGRILDEQEGPDLASFVRGVWEDVKAVGSEAVMKWYRRAAEVGYYDEGKRRVDMAQFIRDAVEFYLEKSARARELELENRALSSALEVMGARLKSVVDRLTLMGITLDMLEAANPDLGLALAPLRGILEEAGQEVAYG